MIKESFIDNQISELVLNGSIFNINDLKSIKEKLLTYKHFKEHIMEDIKGANNTFLNSDTISGISNLIYLHNDISIRTMGGINNCNDEIYEGTLFDIASITKLFTVLLALKLIDKNIINWNDLIKDSLPEFDIDITVGDILTMKGILKTKDRIAPIASSTNPVKVLSKKDIKKAMNLVKTIYLEDKNSYEYSDCGFIILKFYIEKIYNQKLNKKLTFEQILYNELLYPLEIYQTVFNPSTMVAGNGNSLNLVHDPKARHLGGVSAHAGLFTNTNDLIKLSNYIFLLNEETIQLITTPLFLDKYDRKMSLGGIYLRNPIEYKKTNFVPNVYSKSTFAHQGFTGSSVIFDPINKISNCTLVNAIKNNDNFKSDYFFKKYCEFQYKINLISLELLIYKKYHESNNDNTHIYQKIKL